MGDEQNTLNDLIERINILEQIVVNAVEIDEHILESLDVQSSILTYIIKRLERLEAK